jgi:hypothetical protein
MEIDRINEEISDISAEWSDLDISDSESDSES